MSQQQNPVNTYTKLVAYINIACQKGAYNLDDAFILLQSFESLKSFLEQFVISNKPVAADFNKQNLEQKLNNILLGLEKGCRAGAYGFEQAAEAKVVHTQMLQCLKDKFEEKEVEVIN